MKNILKSKTVLIILILTTSGVFIIQGCKKDLKTLPSKEVTQTSQDIKITNMLEAFKTKMKSTLKDGEGLVVDSVVWYLEGCLNETFARASDSIGIIWEDSTLLEIPVTALPAGELVLYSDINQAYLTLVNQLSEHYYSIETEKQLLFVNIELIEVHQESIVIQMKDYVAEKPEPPNPQYIPTFGPGDDWIWGLEAGKCNNGGYLGEDASTQLKAKANILGYGSNVFWLDIYTTPEIWPLDVLIQGYQNPYGYTNSRLYDHSSTMEPEFDDCLTSNQMNYYLNNLRIVGVMYKPIGKSIMNYDIWYDLSTDEGWDHLHLAKISYGIPVMVIENPEELPPPQN